MKSCRFFVFVIAMFFSTTTSFADDTADYVKISTSKGDIIVELATDKAPLSVANFLQYACEGHYDRTIFHRVVTGFVIQGGGYSKYYNERRTRDSIPYEGDNGLKNVRGAIAMARMDDPDSASAQWFINLKDNTKLDQAITDYGPKPGYAVFGRVIEGMDIVDTIGAVETGAGGPFESDVPVEPIVINRIDPVILTALSLPENTTPPTFPEYEFSEVPLELPNPD